MRIGLIFECDKQGTDQQVYEHVIRRLCPTLDFEALPAGNNKRTMIENCGKVARLLIETKQCNKVAIIWDLMPRWGGTPCRKEDTDKIWRNIEAENISKDKIKLVCIEPELEAWLLVDGDPITAYKTQLSHPHPVEKFKGKKLRANSDDAKKEVSRYLGYKYNDVSEALKIAQHIKNYDRIAKKQPSFQRLKTFIDAVCAQ